MAVANVPADIRTPGGLVRTLMEQVQAEYAEMPGLSVTLSQAQRCGLLISRRARRSSADCSEAGR